MRGTRTAFSLIELLVAIGLIAVLIALAVPSLRAARQTARRTVSLSNLSQLGTIQAVFRNGNKEVFPFPTLDTDFPIGCGLFTRFQGTSTRWRADQLWPWLMGEAFRPEGNQPVYFSPLDTSPPRTDGCRWPTSYRFSHGFTARPGCWQPGTSPDADLLLRAVRESEVLFTDRKALLWDDATWATSSTLVLCADNHAAGRKVRGVAPVFPCIFETGVGTMELHNTPGGVGGADF